MALLSVSYFADKILKKCIKRTLTDRLNGVLGDERGLANLFLPLFDCVFDPNKTGRPRFLRSGVASLVALAIISGVWWFFHSQRAGSALEEAREYWLYYIILVIIFAISINLIGDFISLWETRVVIGRMATAGSKKLQAILLILDLVLTVTIYCLGCVLGLLLLEIFVDIDLIDLLPQLFAELFYRGGLTFSNEDMTLDLFGIFFYTTLFTSVWVWEFMLGITLWPLLRWIHGLTVIVDKYPVSVTTVVGGIFLFLFFIPTAILAVVRLFSNTY